MFASSARSLMIWFCLSAPCLLAQSQSKPCGESGTQAEMNQCAAREAKAADQHLNAVYRAMLSKLKSNKIATQKLIAAQRAWIAFRDADLGAMWPIESGENPNHCTAPFIHSVTTWPLPRSQSKERKNCSNALSI